LAALALAGCSDPSGALPVSGRVLVDGEPLQATGATVTFRPNREKGNTTEMEPAGTVDEHGNYTLYYSPGKKGAPPGWYTVQIAGSGVGPGVQTPRPAEAHFSPAKPPFDKKFISTKTSGLEVEVVPNPASGGYDLRLTR
jgi:hypothetical protein